MKIDIETLTSPTEIINVISGGGQLKRQVVVTQQYGTITIQVTLECTSPINANYNGQEVILESGGTYSFTYGEYTDIYMPDNTYYIEFSSNTPIDEKARILGGELIIPRYFSD